MLFLSGATIPSATLPIWAQTLAEFLPASYLVAAFQGIFFRKQSIFDNLPGVGALLLTMVVGLFLARQLFRWEKEEKLPPKNKLWVLAVMAPFLVMGSVRAYNKDHLAQNQIIMRKLQRTGAFLIRNTRVFVGDGKIIENGAVLVKDGKIAGVFEQSAAPDPDKIRADTVEGSGKTVMPGLIDVHVHLGGPAAFSDAAEDYDATKTMPHALGALLYSGVTAARSTGDGLDESLKLRRRIADGSLLGAELFVCGPMFTAEGGHGTEYTRNLPATIRPQAEAQMARTPKTAGEARQQVRDLKKAGVDGIKVILEAGWGDGMLFNRMDLALARAVGEEAHAQNLPLAVHTGDARDVADAASIGAASIEHGSFRDALPDSLLQQLAKQGVYFDPTLGVAEGYAHFLSGNADMLNSSLVQQTTSASALKFTRELLASGKSNNLPRATLFATAYGTARANLLRAWKAGVPLVVGTDAGNPLVFHGPAMHRELRLWVDAGIPATVALQAATANAAKLLRAGNRIGMIRIGMDANLLMVDGNPLEDITATERISLVVFQGERVRRAEIFDQK